MMKQERIVKRRTPRTTDDAPVEIADRRRRRDAALLAESDALLNRIDAALESNRSGRKSA